MQKQESEKKSKSNQKAKPKLQASLNLLRLNQLFSKVINISIALQQGMYVSVYVSLSLKCCIFAQRVHRNVMFSVTVKLKKRKLDQLVVNLIEYNRYLQLKLPRISMAKAASAYDQWQIIFEVSV